MAHFRGAANFKKGRCPRSMDQLTIGWLAGIVDGEGHIGRITSGQGVVIRVEMVDQDIIQRCFDLTGEGKVTGPHNTNRAKNQNHQLTWRWTLADWAGVTRVLLAIYPILSERRQQRIRDLLPQLEIPRLSPCGTIAAYQRHHRDGESACPACRKAYSIYQRQLRNADPNYNARQRMYRRRRRSRPVRGQPRLFG